MNRFSTLALATAAALICAPTYADTISATFSGTVYQTIGSTGYAVGDTVNGSFVIDTTSGAYLAFQIAGQSAVPSTFRVDMATIEPSLTDAIYSAEVSTLSGAPTNSTFTLDLSSLTTWPGPTTNSAAAYTSAAYALLLNGNQLGTNLDTANNPASAFPSTFGYYMGNADGTHVQELDVNLTTISAVPEPTSAALIGSGLLLIAGLGRTRQRRG